METAFFAEDFHLFLGGCSSYPELAQKTGLSHEALERLLVAAAGLGLEGALQVITPPGSNLARLLAVHCAFRPITSSRGIFRCSAHDRGEANARGSWVYNSERGVSFWLM